MIRSPYETKFTREQREGKKNPSRDMTNYVSQQKSARKAAWEARQAKKKDKNK